MAEFLTGDRVMIISGPGFHINGRYELLLGASYPIGERGTVVHRSTPDAQNVSVQFDRGKPGLDSDDGLWSIAKGDLTHADLPDLADARAVSRWLSS